MISGVGPGLGREMAIGAIREGAKVSIACRTQVYLDELSLELRKLGGEVCAVKTDISNEDETQNFVDKTLSQFGRIDALINNAIAGYDLIPFEKSNLNSWKEAIEIMLYGSYNTTKQVI